MNPVGPDALTWIFQQDYMTFLAVLGWLTAGLIAWGNAGAGAENRMIPWKWFALFCVFASCDAILDLARMAAPEILPAPLAPTLRLIAYGCLMEFGRRAALRASWIRVPGWLPWVAVGAAQAIILFVPSTSIPAIGVAFLGGTAAAIAIIGNVTRQSRLLLATAATLLLLGPLEIQRSVDGVTIGGLFGLFVTGEGFATALTASVLAWVAGTALWLYGIVRRRSGFFAGRRESFSPLAAIVLPIALVATLVAGYFLVNQSSRRARHEVEDQYLTLARTAASAIDPDTLERALNPAEAGSADHEVRKIRLQLDALRAGNDTFLRVYLWIVRNGRALVEWRTSEPGDTGNPAIHLTPTISLSGAGPPSLNFDLLGSRDEVRVILANAPVINPITRDQSAWLAIDILPRDWLSAQAVARLQTMALVGLFASLIVFFIAHAMLREHQAELLVAKESAEAADRAKDEFLAVMSHELRTPMQSVLGFSDLLNRTPLSATQDGYVDAIRNQGRTLLRVVQDILDFSTLRKASYTLKKETVYLHRLIQSTFESIRPLAAKRGLRFECSVGNDVPEVVMGDGVRIEQILFNLMGNAVKFTDEGSVSLDVKVERVEEREHGTINWVVFSISDTGLGIRDEDQKQLFKPFTRLSYADHTRREGTGLGLAIAKRISELMGGRIELESTWQQGSRFHVRLPLSTAVGVADDDEDTSSPSAERDTDQLPDLGAVLPLRILVAEDNPFIHRLMKEYLSVIGYEPTSVTNGREAVEQWRGHDLVFLDLRMPEMDGVTAAQKIREQSGHAEQPWIIGVSATLLENEIARAMESGMNDFLGKPFFVQSLVEAIEASPLYERRSAEPVAAEPETADDSADESGGVMSWMPDLTADGGAEIVAQALAEIPEVMNEIDRALQAEDLEQAADRAHYLKNTILALRIEPMRASCLAVNERSAAGDLASARQSMESLRVAFAQWKSDAESKTAGA